MKERPILFSGPMVRALLDGRKTQTRRVVKPMPCYGAKLVGVIDMSDREPPYVSASFLIEEELASRPGAPQMWNESIPCPYGVPGDRLWVKETWWRGFGNDRRVAYVADEAVPPMWAFKKVPSIHMPRWASRITLEVVRVRVERVQAITDADAIAEGCGGPGFGTLAVLEYCRIWDEINGRGSWAENPWVWVIEFKRIGGAA